MADADVEMWLDNVKDVVDDQEGLSVKERIVALRQLIEYIEVTSIPDAEAALPKPKRRAVKP